MSRLFQEKQAELQSAVLRVEQLSVQLEDLRRGKINGNQNTLGGQVTGAAAIELRKLYQELQVNGSRGQMKSLDFREVVVFIFVVNLHTAALILYRSATN